MAEACDFYNKYAKARGYGIRRDSSSYSRKLTLFAERFMCVIKKYGKAEAQKML